MLERSQNTNRVQIVVVADVRDAEHLALHIALAVGYHCVKGLAKFLNDLSGIESIRRTNRGECGRGRCREELQPKGPNSCASHFGTELRIVDQGFPALDQVA